jgi:hypothetical protein
MKRVAVTKENIIESRVLYYAASSSSRFFVVVDAWGGAVGGLENPNVAKIPTAE